jgi:two-component system response regulator
MNISTHADILLVEDNPNDATLTIKALKKRNLADQIVHVTDGQAAVDYLFAEGAYAGRDPSHLPKVVLLDLKLPKLDGLEVLRRIRDKELTRTLPVVILTSSNEERDKIQAYYNGANSYVIKPLEFEQFMEAVNQLGLYWLLLNKGPISNHN